MPKKAPEALICKASGCGRKTEQGWNRVEHFLEQPAVQADDSADAVRLVTVPVYPY